MLEQVAIGQSRFMTPGVAPDPRGVLLGRYGMLQFSNLEGVVSWLRLYSAESSLDEILNGLQIWKVRSPLQSHELLLRIPATTSHGMDVAARCAKLVGGHCFTGSGKHYVKYRDERSPYGYDLSEIPSLPAGTQCMLHGDTHQQSYAKEGEISFEKLLFRLSLRKEIGGQESLSQHSTTLLAVQSGLADGVIRYLWRNRVHAQVALAESQKQSAFDGSAGTHQYLLVKCEKLPARMAELFEATPGIDLFAMKGTKAAVQKGYYHLLDLPSCGSVFADDCFYMFWGKDDRVDVVGGPLRLSAIEHLAELDIDIEGPDLRTNLNLQAPNPVAVPIRLAASGRAPTKVTGTLIPLEQGAWLKRLIYLLPSGVLRGHRIAISDRGIILIAQSGIDLVPLGQLLVEFAPGLFIPAGTEFVPRIAPEVMAASLEHNASLVTVFPPTESPFQVKESSFMALGRQALAHIEVDRAESTLQPLVPTSEPNVVNDSLGAFALWGFRAPPEK